MCNRACKVRKGRMRDVGLNMMPDPWDKTGVFRFLVTADQPRKNPKDPQVSLHGQTGTLCAKRQRVLVCLLRETCDQLCGQTMIDIPSGVAQKRDQIIARRCDKGILVIKYPDAEQPRAVWPPDQVFGMEIPQRQDICGWCGF